MKRVLQSMSRLLAALIICLSSSLLLAQDTSTDAVTGIEDPGQVEQQAQAEQSDGSDETSEENVVGAAVGTIAEADQREESSARFIPSEEISQDLGVSFPVDI